MKKAVYIFILFSIVIFAGTIDSNATKSISVGDLGNLLEGQANRISVLINIFLGMLTIVITIISVVAYKRSSSILNKINENAKSIKDFEKTIEAEVAKQMMYKVNDMVKKAEEYAHEQIGYKMDNTINEAQSKIFKYQKIVFKVNEKKKEEYDNVLKKDITIEKKLEEMVNIQNKYNIINNNDVPKLLSNENDIEKLLSIARDLAEDKWLATIVDQYLQELKMKSSLTPSEKEKINMLLNTIQAKKTT